MINNLAFSRIRVPILAPLIIFCHLQNPYTTSALYKCASSSTVTVNDKFEVAACEERWSECVV
jgi:hypothetical protein